MNFDELCKLARGAGICGATWEQFVTNADVVAHSSAFSDETLTSLKAKFAIGQAYAARKLHHIVRFPKADNRCEG